MKRTAARFFFGLVGTTTLASCHLLLDVGDHHLALEEADDAASADAQQAADARPDALAALVADAGYALQPTVIASGRRRPSVIRVDDTNVYFTEEASEAGPGSVMGMTRTGGTPFAVATNRAQPSGLRVASGAVFFTDDIGGSNADIGVFRVLKSSPGTVAKIDGDDDLGAGVLAFHLGFVYSEAWAPGVPTRIRKTPLFPITAPPLGCYDYVAATSARLSDIIVDDTYGWVFDPGRDAIMRTDLACGAASGDGVVFSSHPGDVRGLLFGTTRIYWITTDSVYRQEKTALGGKPFLLANGGQLLADVTAAGEGVAFTDEAAGTVSFASFETAPHATVIASNQGGPHGITSGSDGALYWTNRSSGEIVRLERR